MKKILTLFLLLTHGICCGQNLITNPDFELFTSCPTTLGQVSLANSWFDVVINADYYNCGLSTSPYISNSTAYSGTGFMGFASYGDANGSAEAIGQYLSQPLLSGHSYTATFVAKKTTNGIFSSICGGIALYGFKNTTPPATGSIHTSQLPNAILLGIGDTVSNSNWQTFSINFIPSDTINEIVFTVEPSPNCQECVFIDNIYLQIAQPNSALESNNDNRLNVFPNPFISNLNIQINDSETAEIILYNLSSKKILQQTITNTTTINTEKIVKGIYFYELRSRNGDIKIGKIIKQ
jgi:hypothetical protein